MAQRINTGTQELLAELDQGVVTLTLNRPHARNALSDELSPAMRRMFAKLGQMTEARCVVVTGAGTAFCAGGDVKAMAGRPAPKPAASNFEPSSRRDPEPVSSPVPKPRTRQEVIDDLTERQRALTGALYELPQPTIASLPGPAAGAGLAIALACDIRIAAESAFVTTGFRNVGLAGDYGVSFFLTQLVGTAKARELFFTGERVDAARCERLGIVNRVVPDDALERETKQLARQLAAGPSVAYRYMKQNLDRALREDLPTCLAHEAAATVATAGTEDHREAVRSFVEKRKPVFRGR